MMSNTTDFILKHIRETLGAVTFFVFIVLFPSLGPVALAVIISLAGWLLVYYTVRPNSLLQNVFFHIGGKKLPVEDLELTLLKKICPVCGNEKCNRHRPELNIVALQPWTNLKIPQRIDNALEQFLDLVLKDFVYTWYRDLSQDEAFVDDLRFSLRFLVTVLIRRLQKVDIPTFVTDRVLKTAIRHLHFYLEVKKKAPPGTDIENTLLNYYGAHLHATLRNRRAELDYLRNMSERLFPYVLPLQSLKCKSLCILLRELVAGAILLPALDVLADPDMVNNILLVFFDKSPAPPSLDPLTPLVHVLGNFSHPLNKHNSSLHLELNDILDNQEALFPFMQFMKAEASVNVLQFYLTVDEFNDKILNPDLTEEQLNNLHLELNDLYKIYCDPKAVDRIQFDEEIVNQLREICTGPASGVIKLQTSTPLFRAQDHTFDLLEKSFLPLFHQSDDYYRMLCGERLPTRLQRSLSRSSKRSADALSLAKIGNKIKGVFKSNTVDGKLADEAEYALEETECNSLGGVSFSNLVATDRMWDDRPLHDLSAFRVTIPDILSMPEPDNARKKYYTFMIEVRRIDVLENDFERSNWTVQRKYAEFYVLEQKLTEFHGEFEDTLLPPKKAFGTKKEEFLESVRLDLEQYLQKLLTKPLLRGSQLLYAFLTSDYEFTTGFLPDINLGKIMKTGAMRLVKERGQHLDPYLSSFLQSTESSKPRPCRWSDRDSDTVSISSEKMANSLYENNANTDLSLTPDVIDSREVQIDATVPVDGIFDTLIYLAEYVYEVPDWLHSLLMSSRIILKNSVDSYLNWFIGYKLDRVLQEHRTERIIHLLRDAIFFDTGSRTEEDRKIRRDQALKELKDFIPKLFVMAVGSEKHNKATELFFEALQQPRLNKQLSYMLLDDVLREVFPELLTESEVDAYSGLFGNHRQ